MEWQQIETAPKDGTPILTWTSGLLEKDFPFIVVRWERGEWKTVDPGSFYAPEYWTPLPTPPSNT